MNLALTRLNQHARIVMCGAIEEVSIFIQLPNIPAYSSISMRRIQNGIYALLEGRLLIAVLPFLSSSFTSTTRLERSPASPLTRISSLSEVRWKVSSSLVSSFFSTRARPRLQRPLALSLSLSLSDSHPSPPSSLLQTTSLDFGRLRLSFPSGLPRERSKSRLTFTTEGWAVSRVLPVVSLGSSMEKTLERSDLFLHIAWGVERKRDL